MHNHKKTDGAHLKSKCLLGQFFFDLLLIKHLNEDKTRFLLKTMLRLT